MRSFFTELGRFLATVWGNAWRWTIHRKRNLLITVGALALIVVVIAAVQNNGGGLPGDPDATPTPTPTETVDWVEATATPAPGSSLATGQTGEPTPPTTDLSGAEETAKAWASGYLERVAEDDNSWRGRIEDITMPGVIEQLSRQAFEPENILHGEAPTRLTDVTISAPEPDAEKNTPVRWSRNLTATVEGANSTTEVTFGVVLVKGGAGWMVTSVEEISAEVR